jgi:tripeptidyl-peptidase I
VRNLDTTRSHRGLTNGIRYGAHLSTEEVHALVAPHPDTLELVDAWLAYHDINSSSAHRSGSGDAITLHVSVAQAERMLGTTIFWRAITSF